MTHYGMLPRRVALDPDDLDQTSTKIYLCPGCNRWRPWCDGCSDDMGEHCDRCWAEAHEPWWRRLINWIFRIHLGDHGCDDCAPHHRVYLLDDDRYELYPLGYTVGGD